MIFPSVKRSDIDKGFTTVRNQHSAALVDGDVVKWALSTDAALAGYTKLPGVDVIGSTATPVNPAGVISNPQGGSCAQGDYCLCQTYGLHTNVKTTAAALAAGATANGDAANAAVAGAAADDPSMRIGFCLTVGAANRAGIFIRLM